MSKQMRNFIYYYAKTALVLGLILLIYEKVGPFVAGDYFNLIWWGILVASILILVFIGWRLWIGINNGSLRFDNTDD